MIIDVTNIERIQTDTTSSKGNQNKWHINGKWYKMDNMGYEGLAEIITSEMLKKSNIFAYVPYHFAKLSLYDKEYNGCFSKEIKNDGETLIPLERLIRQKKGINLAEKLNKIATPIEKIEYTINLLSSIGVKNAGEKMTFILELDALTLNQDRHTNNISFIKKEDGTIDFAPVYDNGDAFLSDEMYYPLNKPVNELIRKVTAKPFSGSFIRQMTDSEKLYGKQIQLSFTQKDLQQIMTEAKQYYPENIIKRVTDIITYQMNQYSDYFSKESKNRQKIDYEAKHLADNIENKNPEEDNFNF